MIKISFFFLAMVLAITISANNITISNLSFKEQNTAENYSMVQFDISWENSWRSSSTTNNWDAAWLFVKYRLPVANGGDGLWKHAWLNNSGHNAPTGSTIEIGLLTPAATFNSTTNPGIGAFIYRNVNGTGTFSKSGVKLRWNYGTNGVFDNAVVDIKVFAIEMVYVPTGSFFIGSGGNESSPFYKYPITLNPYQVNSEAAITVSNTENNLYYNSPYGGDRLGPVTANFPKGYKAFYCMKYEISQQGYVDFLNLLSYAQQASRTEIAPNSVSGTYLNGEHRHKIKIGASGTNNSIPATYTTDYPYVACNRLNWADLAAYLDWSGLRPMTELEFEKSCRGSMPAVANELAWGTTNIAMDQYTLSNSGTNDESIATNYSSTAGNAAYHSTVPWGHTGSIDGPLRVGIFTGTIGNTGRESSGATYYGIMEMSGNLNERTVTVGNDIGRAFIGTHGNGILTSAGNADAISWPGNDEVGTGFRGAAWDYGARDISVSDRMNAAYATPDLLRGFTFGGRGVRSAP